MSNASENQSTSGPVVTDAPSAEPGRVSRRTRVVARSIVQAVLCLALLGGAGLGVWLIYSTEPTAERDGATRQSAALVETVTVERGSYTPSLEVLGRVEAARDIVLSPRISGRVESIHPSFVPGGLVEAGQPLITLDEADFRNTLARMKSDLMQVKAELAIEQGRQDVARQEFELLGEQISENNRALVLREPQIESIKARIESAQASLDQAQLDLDRTRVTSPFDAQIMTRSVNVGSQVSPSTPLARLVGTDAYWVMATVPLRQLRWLEFPEGDRPGSTATLRMPAVWGPDAQRTGQLLRLIGNVDEQTRLARVLIEVQDPLATERDAPPMVLGTLVDVAIEARRINDVAWLDRQMLREQDTVWVMADGKLEIRRPTIVFRDADHAYIGEGLAAGERVVLTNLATVTPGLALREVTEQTAADTGAQTAASP